MLTITVNLKLGVRNTVFADLRKEKEREYNIQSNSLANAANTRKNAKQTADMLRKKAEKVERDGEKESTELWSKAKWAEKRLAELAEIKEYIT